ncbi:hypothetical protein JTB14_021938 [Gonioctena quinquepunctata]|nr:hypothetical protein JTB14_021938 [Gonioctena quinquepunctata]
MGRDNNGIRPVLLKLLRSKSNIVEQDCANTPADDTDDSDIEPTEQSIGSCESNSAAASISNLNPTLLQHKAQIVNPTLLQHQAQIVNPTLLQHQVQIFD